MIFSKKISIILLVVVVLLSIVVGFELSQRKITSSKSGVSQNKQLTVSGVSIKSSIDKDVQSNNHQTVVTTSEKAQIYAYYPSTITLEGFVRKLVGDTPDQDKKFTYFVLEVDKPINVKGNPDDPNGNTDSFENVTKLQFFTQGKASDDIRNLIDKRVIVQGRLLQVLDFPDFTDVMIQTSQIKESKS